ncbi:hypothetical protein [Pelosinus propionicus]|uniref:Uncharacterized protein n=1 Tax=Pelosinus propionicus DSM 13327 TaxID=1123291 RepID=A0A1I4N7W3_9FIRM|nr:hypothetical protein [Pelosinus propionicus]SFM11644.1 hypothetical protein SAMN04490355_104221 [Pelosinus propionicus DSM 13327]
MLKSTTTPIKSIISGQTIPAGDFEEGWQELVLKRQVMINEKLDAVGLSTDCLVEMLEKSASKELAEDIKDTIFHLQTSVTYTHYNKGFLDGIKFAMMAGQL